MRHSLVRHFHAAARTLLPTLLAASAALGQTAGQPPFEACNPGGFTVIGYPDEIGPQAEANFDVYVNEGFLDGFLTQERIWLPSINSGIEAWNNLPGATWKFNNRGLSSNGGDPFDGFTTIAPCGGLFACPAGPPPTPPPGPGGGVVDYFPQSILAVTLVMEDLSFDHAIADSDVFFNPAMPFEVNPNDGQVDFETVLVHELGHALGLGHNDNCASGNTVMRSVVGLNERKREPGAPEQAGVRFLYSDGTDPGVSIYESERKVRFTSRRDGLPPFEREVNLHGIRGHRWKATANQPWVSFYPDTDIFDSDETIQIGVDPKGLADGTHVAVISVIDERRPNSPNTIQVEFVISSDPSADKLPKMSSAGIVNGANLYSKRLSPGSLITLFGENLASAVDQASSFPLPTRLGGTEVVINGFLAPLLYVSPLQINAIVPYESVPGRGGLIVRNSFGQDLGTPFDVLQASPEFFVWLQDHAIAFNQNGTLNTPQNPAHAGEIVSMYLTGIGPVNPPVSNQQPAPFDPLSWTALPFDVRLAGLPAQATYLGLTPGFAGLAQLNVVVPNNITGELPIALNLAGQSHNFVKVSVR